MMMRCNMIITRGKYSSDYYSYSHITDFVEGYITLEFLIFIQTEKCVAGISYLGKVKNGCRVVPLIWKK